MRNVLVIIVTYNAMKWAERCINSIIQSDVHVDVYVIDNGSSDGTQEFFRNNYPNVFFTQNESNEGFGAANNKGMIYALKNSYKYVYLLNQDAWVDSNVFSQLILLAEKHPEYGVLSPLQMTGDGKKMDKNFHFNVMEKRCKGLLKDLNSGCIKDIYATEFVMAAHWFLRTEDLLKVGLFSPAFQHYGEDGNLISRYKYWGYKIGICPQIKAYHDRQYRKDSPEKQLYLNYVRLLVELNNPLRINYVKIWIKFFLKLFSIKNVTFKQRLSNIKKAFSCVNISLEYKNKYKKKNCISIINNYSTE